MNHHSVNDAARVTPDADELVARAAALRPRLRQRQNAHERLGSYDRQTHEELHEAGLYRLLTPRRFGGLEIDLETFLRVGVEIARGDPAVGWSFVLTGAHVFHVASLFTEAGQIELLGDRELVAPMQVLPAGRAEPVAGGHRVSGTWAYCSGATWSTDVLVPAEVTLAELDNSAAPAIRLFAVPRSDYEILDDWGDDATLGMGASGSNSVRITGSVVPVHRSIPHETLMGGIDTVEDSPGFQLHGNPMYLGRTAMLFAAELVAAQVGAAWAAADEYLDLMTTRSTTFPPVTAWIDSDDHHRRFGSILSLASAAEELLLGAARRHGERSRAWVATGAPFTAAEDLRLRGIVAQAGRLAGEAVDLALTTAGTGATRRTSRLARYHRDVTMYRTHVLAQHDMTAVASSRAHLKDVIRRPR